MSNDANDDDLDYDTYSDLYDDSYDNLEERVKSMPEEAWWNQPYADFHDPRAYLQKLIDETNKAILQAQGYIKRQEDGPVTMYHALKKIARRLAAVEVEVAIILSTLEGYEDLVAIMTQQRNDAVYHQTVLRRYFKSQHWDDDAP